MQFSVLENRYKNQKSHLSLNICFINVSRHYHNPRKGNFLIDKTPNIDGSTLDNVIDYLNYVVIPSLMIYWFQMVPAGWEIIIPAAIFFVSFLYFVLCLPFNRCIIFGLYSFENSLQGIERSLLT